MGNLDPSRVNPAPSILDVLTAIVGIIDMSNPDHPTFADSAADCLDELLRHEADIRALVDRAQAFRSARTNHIDLPRYEP